LSIAHVDDGFIERRAIRFFPAGHVLEAQILMVEYPLRDQIVNDLVPGRYADVDPDIARWRGAHQRPRRVHFAPEGTAPSLRQLVQLRLWY